MIRSSAAIVTAAIILLGAGCDSAPEEDGEAPEPRPSVSTDTAPSDTTEQSGRRQSYYVHLRPGTDPRRFAARYGLTPTDVITDPRPGLVVAVTPAERRMLADDSLVESLARQIHSGGGDTAEPAIRSPGGDTTEG